MWRFQPVGLLTTPGTKLGYNVMRLVNLCLFENLLNFSLRTGAGKRDIDVKVRARYNLLVLRG